MYDSVVLIVVACTVHLVVFAAYELVALVLKVGRSCARRRARPEQR